MEIINIHFKWGYIVSAVHKQIIFFIFSLVEIIGKRTKSNLMYILSWLQFIILLFLKSISYIFNFLPGFVLFVQFTSLKESVPSLFIFNFYLFLQINIASTPQQLLS